MMSQGAKVSGSDPRHRPIARFLGAAEAAGGPFALLGLNPQACTDELVLSALDRQIERLNRHPECDTPEADEVRLALHAAAAQLLDPVVRRHLVSRWGKAPMQAPGTPAAPPAGRQSTKVPDAQRLLEADAILTLGLFGGWNQRSLRRLVTLAHRRGLTNRQVAEALRNLSTRRGRARPSRPQAEAPRRAPSSRLQAVTPPAVVTTSGASRGEVDPAQKLLRNAIMFGFLGLVGVAATVVGIIVATSESPTPTAPPPVATNPPSVVTAPPEADITPAPKKVERPLPPPADPADLAAIPREISACTEALSLDASAAAIRFEAVVGKLGAHWPSIPKDRLVASLDAIVEYLYRAARQSDIGVRAIGAIGRSSGPLSAGDIGPADIAPAVWSTGMLARLGRERDLPATMKAAIESSLSAILGPGRAMVEQSFEGGAAAGLAAWPPRLTPTGATAATEYTSVESWKAWGRCVDALTGTDAFERQRSLLGGLEVLLVQGPEPNENKTVAPAITELVSRVTWRQNEDSRRWLLRWFADGRISTADLNAVTSALATRTSASGVDLTMVLSTSASENTRAEMRERYATVWGVQESLARDQIIQDWAKIAREAINDSYVNGSDADDLAAAVVLARLNDAAWWHWRGDNAEAQRLIADIKGPVEQAMTLSPHPEGGARESGLSDGAWAERYFGARSVAKLKRELIEQVASSQQIGPVDAEVLVGEALTGSPQDVRAAAIEAVKKFADSPAMLNAILERLPRLPRTSSAADMVAAIAATPLPGFRDPDWAVQARRAIVERLLEVMAQESPRVRIDRLSMLLASNYHSMASGSPLPPDQRVSRSQPPVALSAGEAWRRWRSSADTLVPSSPPPIPMDQIERRRLGRRSQARGMVQEFAAEQASIAEVMSYIVACEHPTKIADIRLVLTNLASDRRRARTVLEQIKITERAIAQLWLIRMQQEPAT